MIPLARIVTGLAAGSIFGFGLSLSGMLDPGRVRGFLDVAGQWNPSLAFVLGGAVAASAVGQAIARRLRAPLFDSRFEWPKTHPIDARLIVGSAIFGIGWGMAGLCPGPAVATLALGLLPTAAFVIAMVAGMLLFRLLPAPATPATRIAAQERGL
jgi:uncharacterized membrane protein YedE/YeeE